MAKHSRKPLIETAALIVGYAMSRLNVAFLKHFGFSTWKQAYVSAGSAQSFEAPPRNLPIRDEPRQQRWRSDAR